MTKEYLMIEVLSLHNTLVENKWITHYPKSVAIAQLLSKDEIIFKNYSKKMSKVVLKAVNSRKERSLKEIRSMNDISLDQRKEIQRQRR